MGYKKNSKEKSNIRLKKIVGYLIFGIIVSSGVLSAIYLITTFTKNDSIQLTEIISKPSTSFDETVLASDKEYISNKLTNVSLKDTVNVSVSTTTTLDDPSQAIDIYVPVSSFYSPMQSINSADLKKKTILFDESISEEKRQSIVSAFGMEKASDTALKSTTELTNESILFIPISKLTSQLRLLSLNDEYYLDSYKSGAIFRVVQLRGAGASELSSVEFNENKLSENSVTKVNMTGVTALTRRMLKKYSVVKDPSYFGEKIADFLADADLTHISNEVSFKENCSFSNSVFCSEPELIETLKDSGVDIVELTGNHNNDVGTTANKTTLELYEKLGWATFGGGLNRADAAKYHVAESNGSKIAFLGYNYPDSPNGVAIAKETTAGANPFDFDVIANDINSAKKEADFVIVDVQYWECYSYPDGYKEFPECDAPITNQKEIFRKIADLGANMVIGTQAHQPQTYEIYNNTPIYYGLGNLYFEQIEWPGTERGIILTHYITDNGTLLQTKLTPTVFDDALQTRISTQSEATYLLKRLYDARPKN